MFIDDDYDTVDIGYCTRCGKLLDTEPPTAMQCWDCMDED